MTTARWQHCRPILTAVVQVYAHVGESSHQQTPTSNLLFKVRVRVLNLKKLPSYCYLFIRYCYIIRACHKHAVLIVWKQRNRKRWAEKVG